jgi:hypothetical protein
MTQIRARLAAPGMRLLVCVALAAGLAACGEANVPTPGPTATRAPDPTPTVTVYDLGATVWYEGLIVHVDRATATLDPRGGPLVLTLRIENPTGDAGELNGPIRIAVGTIRVEPNHDSSVPLVPPNESMPVQLTYDLQGIASVDAGAIEIGVSPDHIARVPFTSQGGDAAFLQPVSLTVTGAATSVDLKITLRGGELRSDLPDWSQELSASLEVLTLTYDATYAGTFGGGFAFTGDNVALRLPDGTVVSARRDGHSQSVELIGANKTKKGLFSRFEIPSGLRGKFALLVRNGSTQKAIVFTIGG